jgi:DNA-directed RNA polymerase sigma subunit (sigma70/sigma32)
MSSFVPPEDGWPYPDGDRDASDPEADVDDDLLSLRIPSAHVLDGLDPVEHTVITARYGLDGRPPRSMKEIHAELGLSRAELRLIMGSALEKLRSRLQD